MWLWLEFRAYLGSPRRSMQGQALINVVSRAAGPVHIFAKIAIKHEENRVFENAQIDVPG